MSETTPAKTEPAATALTPAQQEFARRYFVERKGTNSLKWDALRERFGDADLLSLWVADMDFRVADCITSALNERITHGVYGYSFVPSEFYRAYFDWAKTRHGLHLEKSWTRFSNGVVQSIYNLLHAFSEPGDKVVILPPVYYQFARAIKDTGRQEITVPLRVTGGRFEIDFDEFERVIASEKPRIYIHCSPHNPAGRVWTENEQQRLFEICAQHDVLIIADEVHQDLVFAPHVQVPSFNVADGVFRDRIITVTAASKSFNLATLAFSLMFIADSELRAKYDSYASTHFNSELNLLGMIATQSAYASGAEWLENVKAIVQYNAEIVKRELAAGLPGAHVFTLEGTYLLFIDLNPVLDGQSAKEIVQNKAKLAIDFGEWFGEGFAGFIRINLATKPEIIAEAVERLIAAFTEN
ncbi:MAG: MalY/PatB family protein [Microbacteriaceae bacterium]|nr:MalY/PatB family protein [Microbacteriaceae bacterium]